MIFVRVAVSRIARRCTLRPPSLETLIDDLQKRLALHDSLSGSSQSPTRDTCKGDTPLQYLAASKEKSYTTKPHQSLEDARLWRVGEQVEVDQSDG